MPKLDPNQNDTADEYDDLYEDLYGEPAHSNRQRAQERGYRPKYGPSSRRPAADREASFNVWMWLLEGATGVIEEVRHNDLGLSEDFWVHAAAARREGLLAVRAVIDQMVDEEVQQEEKARDERRARRGGIQVD
jgi:hypothetical protein